MVLILDEGYNHNHTDSQDNGGYISFNHLSEGCPNFIPENETYNVLKYHSDYRIFDTEDEDLGIGSKSLGIIGDGYNLDINFDEFSTEHYEYDGSYTTTKFGEDRFLNLANTREISADLSDPLGNFTDDSDKSIQNIPITDELRAKDGNGDFVFNLFKKSESISITNAETGSTTTETVDTAEFMFFHAKIESCQEGWIALEISNFELTGYTNDNMLYAYYWEGTEAESLSTEAQVTSGTQPITFDNFRMLNNTNTCVQAFRMSDITGGTGKKLIVGCNKFTSDGEELYINLMIGLKPADIVRHHQYKKIQTGANEYTINVSEYDEVGAPVFKYKQAEFVFSGEQSDTWNNKPLFWPSEGFKDAQTGSSTVHILTAPFQYLDSSDRGVATPEFRTTGNTKIGIPNGGTKSSVNGQSYLNQNSPSTFGNASALGTKEPNAVTTAHGTYNRGFSIAKVGEITGSSLKQNTSFVFRMPQCYGAIAGTVTGWDGSDQEETFSSASFNVNLYVGDPATQQDDLIKWHDLADSLYLLQTWSLSSFYSKFSQCYDYSAKAGTYPTYLEDVRGYPYNAGIFPNEDQSKIDQGKFVTIDMADIIANGNGVLTDYCLYIALESSNGGISKTLSYAVTDEGGSPTGAGFVPSGYATSSEPASSESATLLFKSMYDNGSVVGASFDQGISIGNCGSMFFKSPSIIPIGTTATPENYYQ